MESFQEVSIVQALLLIQRTQLLILCSLLVVAGSAAEPQLPSGSAAMSGSAYMLKISSLT